MSTRSFREMFEEAEKHPDFHKELAILEFTEELWRVMQEKGVTGTELGRRIGSSQAYISRVLNGGANFTLGSMTKLAMGLGMELKLHLAPTRAVTAWRDYHPAYRATPEGGQVIPLSFSETPRHPSRYAGAATTALDTASLPDGEVKHGAAASAA
ncbi:MAG: helix-turn-helix domain-containing protein [Candidatus Bipolaricaulia bacterium]